MTSVLFEPPHDKTNKVDVRPAKTQISLGIHQFDQGLRCALSADAQADLSLRWAHSHFVGFVMSRLIYNSDVPQIKLKNCLSFGTINVKI